MMYGSWDTLLDRQTDRKSDIKRWVPHLKTEKLEYLENKTIFLQNKKILNLCLRWHILRSCCFVVEVTFNIRSDLTIYLPIHNMENHIEKIYIHIENQKLKPLQLFLQPQERNLLSQKLIRKLQQTTLKFLLIFDFSLK